MPALQTSFLLLLVLSLPASTESKAALHVTVKDRTGAAFPNVLLIVQSLRGKGEQSRALSDSGGSTPRIELEPGLYRVIATCPYGLCETKLKELLIGSDPVDLALTLDVRPISRGTLVGDLKFHVNIMGPDNRPASGAHVLMRNSDASVEEWLVADEDGELLVDAIQEPIILVVSHAGRLEERNVGPEEVDELARTKSALIIRVH